MKKTTLFSLLTMLLLFVGSNVWAEETWVKTDPSDLQTGDVVVIVELTHSYALPNNNGTTGAPGGITVSLNDDKTEISSEPAQSLQWVVTVDESSYKFGIEGTTNYLYCTDTNNGIRVGTNSNNVFTISEEGYLVNTATNRYVGVYLDRPDWRCYTSINNNIKDQSFGFFKKEDNGGGVARPTFSPAGGVYAESVTVTISADEDCYILYTTDGVDPQVSTTATLVEANTATVEVTETTTIRAYALYMGANMSSEASATYTIVTPISTIAELCAAAPAEGTNVEEIVEFNNWVVTGVKNSNVYFTDGANGILLYQSGHNFEVGDVLTGKALVTLTSYKGAPEVKGLTSSTEGVTVTKSEGATPMTDVSIADLETNMQGCLITLEGVTYSEGKFVDDDDNTITPYNTFVALPTFIEGKTYNVTGVVIWYLPNSGSGYWEIAPRTADEIELLTTQVAPESSWSVEEEVVDVNETPTAVFTTNSDGVVTYESSNEEVATIDENGVITPVGKGTTTITANVAETETYLPDSKSFTLKVTVEGYVDATFKYNDTDIVGQGASEVGAELTATRNEVLTLYANKAYAKPEDTHIKIYGSKYEGSEEEGNRTLTEPSYIKLSVAVPYVITKVVMTATGKDYIKEWKDQSGKEAVISGTTATWEGVEADVILTNLSTAQARIKTIEVTYVNTDIVTAISTPTSVQSETAIYNLAGQRLSKMQKGINIVGGKKILK